ncbi:hypothetical protein FisN_10Lh285 [Fistulifera solaris]|uniref:TLC domain-containing protein n=1 Tax=Fistulifera solaris TaxID=1519565 RepID=A0A1Z5KFV1_FISSO|nr:hypothetical protein FisN_10Lh285 [Fistulifera solaris]|eukprot:GAX25086.1 hypothetical protein FisN_10Lh285 [Fistulifera solaris]
MVTIFGWPAVSFVTKTASASVPAMLHSSLLVPSLWQTFRIHRYRPSESLAEAPAFYQHAATCLLQFCTGYMLYDCLLNVLWLNWTMSDDGIQGDALMFLGHHIATTLYMTLCRIHRAGHQSAFICMFLGEMTNPFHNAYFIAIAAQQLECCNGPLSQQLYLMIEYLFSVAYVAVRACVAPFFFVHATFSLWYDRNPQVPLVTMAFWTFLIWLVEIASIPYIQDCWNKIVVERSMVGTAEL